MMQKLLRPLFLKSLGQPIVLAVVLGLSASQLRAARLMVEGVAVPPEIRLELKGELEKFELALGELRSSESSFVQSLLPDVEIYFKAVDWALRYDEFIRTNEFAIARQLIRQGRERAAALSEEKAPWGQQTGLVVRGYRSRIDDSVQPYGLVIPDSYAPSRRSPFRTDVWLHGRDNRLSELKFIHQRQESAGQFTPADTFVLHPYGRFCNAFKFAGEVDVFEALEAVKRHYPVDERRIAIRGFSMGGAGCWHLAVHHPSLWVAAAPGAGFAESAEYLGLWRKDPKPTWYQQKLWGLYDATKYARNLIHVPTVAYSGEIDKQIQAAEIMADALAAEGIRLRHVIGPNTPHRYHPEAKEEVSERIDSIVKLGKDLVPRRVRLTTSTLRYAESHWIEVTGLGEHWQRASVDAELRGADELSLELENVTSLRVTFGAGESPFAPGTRPRILIDQSVLQGRPVLSDRSWNVELSRLNKRWIVVGEREETVLKKRPGLQGPIDDAFFDRFVIVEPSKRLGTAASDDWIRRELNRLKVEWRGQFRGEPLVVRAEDLNEQHLQAHIIAFGDPSNNPFLARIQDTLPVSWEDERIRFAGLDWERETVVPLLVYPNPLNPGRYVVLNSGFTFRGYGSNATQVPMLPDYAFVDTRTPADTNVPGAVVHAGFFDETWKVAR
jgi:dienelactone hydrolase